MSDLTYAGKIGISPVIVKKNKLTDFIASVSEAVRGSFCHHLSSAHRKTSQSLLTEKGSIWQFPFNSVTLHCYGKYICILLEVRTSITRLWLTAVKTLSVTHVTSGNTFSSNTTEALLNHASETGQWRSSARNMSGNPTLYKAVLVRHPFKIFSFSKPSTRIKKPISRKNYSPWSTRCSGHVFSSPVVFRWASDSDEDESNLLMATNRASSAWVAPTQRWHLGGSDCPHCGDMSLRTLRIRVAIVQGDELAQIALPRSSSAASFEPRRKVPRVFDTDLSGSGDEPAPVQCLRAPHPPAAGPLSMRFMTADLRPFPDAQDVVSFGAMEGTEEEDDAISVAASAREEWSNSPLDYTAPHGSDTGDLHHSDVELLSLLSKAVDELGLEWAPPAELTRSRLDEWYLQSDRGRKDAWWDKEVVERASHQSGA